MDRSAVQLDLGVRAGASNELISVAGSIPLNVDDQVDLTVESHGDALENVAALAGDALQMKGGTTDLRLIIRGPLNQPLANGYLVVNDGNLMLGLSPCKS